MRILGGVFTFRLWPTVITFLMLIVLIGLGTWQLERLHWKENLIATINQRMSQAPVDVLSLKTGVDDLEYRPVQAMGLFRHDKEMYLSAISLKGEGGYHVLVALRLKAKRYLLVDRGWIPYDRLGSKDWARPLGLTPVKGVLRLPPWHRWMQPVNHPDKNEWYGIDLAAMAKAANILEFLPYYLEVDATPNAGGYPVGGQTRVALPNDHLGYALTWYGLAAVLLVIYGVSGWQRRRKK